MKIRVRIALGLLLAVGLVAGLQWYVSRPDETASTAPAPGAATRRPPPPPDPAAQGRDLIDSLRGTAGRFHLAAARETLPGRCAPVLRVRPGGVVQIPVAPPIQAVPGPAVWPDVGIVLPRAALADLSAAERASLVGIWSALMGDHLLRPDRIVPHGCTFRPGELETLLRWLR